MSYLIIKRAIHALPSYKCSAPIQNRCNELCVRSSKRRNRNKKHQESKQENETESEILSNFTKTVGDKSTFSIQSLRAAMEALTMNQKPAKTPEEALSKSYQFWNTQPVPKMGTFFFK